jgi:hypothetical protein
MGYPTQTQVPRRDTSFAPPTQWAAEQNAGMCASKELLANKQKPQSSMELAGSLESLAGALEERIGILLGALENGPTGTAPGIVQQPPMGLNQQLSNAIASLTSAHKRFSQLATHLGLEA